jgi:hypothetical protein
VKPQSWKLAVGRAHPLRSLDTVGQKVACRGVLAFASAITRYERPVADRTGFSTREKQIRCHYALRALIRIWRPWRPLS